MVSCLYFQSNDNAHLLHQPIVFCKSKSRIEGQGVKRRVMCCFRDLCYLTSSHCMNEGTCVAVDMCALQKATLRTKSQCWEIPCMHSTTVMQIFNLLILKTFSSLCGFQTSLGSRGSSGVSGSSWMSSLQLQPTFAKLSRKAMSLLCEHLCSQTGCIVSLHCILLHALRTICPWVAAKSCLGWSGSSSHWSQPCCSCCCSSAAVAPIPSHALATS